jgi:hypothetical protein
MWRREAAVTTTSVTLFSHNWQLSNGTLCASYVVIVSPGTPVQSSSELNLNSVNQLIFVMVKCGVLFEVRTEFLNNI